jgi:uncharacterized protein YacL (UPF0231 family)
MHEEFVELIKQGVLGIVCVMEAIVIGRLFALLIKSKDAEIHNAKEGTKVLLDALNEQTESNDRLTSYVQGRDRIGPNAY